MPDPAPSVVVVGSINVDHIVTAPRFPRPGETVLGTAVTSSVGGKGANQAVAASLAGATVEMVASTGDDANGATARDRLVARGVRTTHVAVVGGEPTGTAWITVAEEDNTIIVVSGANALWPDGPLPTAVRTAAVVLSQLEIPIAVVRAAAQQTQGSFVLNAAPAAALPADLLKHCDVLVVNEHELAVVADVDRVDDADAITLAHAGLRDRGVGAVVTTRGAAGVVVTDTNGVTTILDAVRSDVVDTTGAGDAFAGVLAARLANGEPLVQACRWGVVAGALAVRGIGAQDSYPDLPTLTHAVQETNS
ncbi:ribokinase [Mycolicibacterium sp. P9-64]|uniref:ribokinase n=1 Tax=Mycolicibacterium sp. P9-64 TaxID=2024612 RepID=UPI0011EBEE7D|nr:ribokinase [Mycolicibacterium sp. P9-64]KAA0082682.1 ribokinase [Mycolicibacterium sp. P9-64]